MVQLSLDFQKFFYQRQQQSALSPLASHHLWNSLSQGIEAEKAKLDRLSNSVVLNSINNLWTHSLSNRTSPPNWLSQWLTDKDEPFAQIAVTFLSLATQTTTLV